MFFYLSPPPPWDTQWLCCYCDFVLIKLLNNFLTVGLIWMKLSGVARLVPSNFWVSSSFTQYLRGRPWPAPWFFAWNVITLQFLKLPSCVIPFRKGFDKANRMLGVDFWFGAHMGTCRCWKWGGWRGGNFWRILQFCIKPTCVFLFFDLSPQGCGAVGNLYKIGLNNFKGGGVGFGGRRGGG